MISVRNVLLYILRRDLRKTQQGADQARQWIAEGHRMLCHYEGQVSRIERRIARIESSGRIAA